MIQLSINRAQHSRTRWNITFMTAKTMDYSKSCKNRWRTVNGLVSKFVGAYNQAKERKRRGESKDDVLINDYKIHERDMRKRFNLDHAWYLLKNDPKWMLNVDESPPKRTNINQLG